MPGPKARIHAKRRTNDVGAWLSLVEHLVRDQGVGGSNPLAPTIPIGVGSRTGTRSRNASPARFPLDTTTPSGPMLPWSMPHLHVVVRGRVQGVGFRSYVWSRARALAVAG